MCTLCIFQLNMSPDTAVTITHTTITTYTTRRSETLVPLCGLLSLLVTARLDNSSQLAIFFWSSVCCRASVNFPADSDCHVILSFFCQGLPSVRDCYGSVTQDVRFDLVLLLGREISARGVVAN